MCLHATTFQSPKVEERSPGLRIRQGIFGGTMLYGSRNGKDGKPIPKTQLQGIFARLFWLLTFFFHPPPLPSTWVFPPFQQKTQPTRTTKRLKVQMQQQQLCHFT